MVAAIKVAHHGSKGNLTAELKKYRAQSYLISTNGRDHDHPDSETFARLVVDAEVAPTFYFNFPKSVHLGQSCLSSPGHTRHVGLRCHLADTNGSLAGAPGDPGPDVLGHDLRLRGDSQPVECVLPGGAGSPYTDRRQVCDAIVQSLIGGSGNGCP